MPSIYDIPFDNLTLPELREQLRTFLAGDTPAFVVTPNPEMVLQSRREPPFLEALKEAHLSLPDGMGFLLAVAALTDERVPIRHTGVDAVYELAALANQEGKRMLLFGGKTGTAEKTAKELQHLMPDLDVYSVDPGPIEGNSRYVPIPQELTEAIKQLQPDILIVALGQGKQERFILQLLPELPNLKVAIGVGGAFEMISGELPRAPKLLRRFGLEWLWRVTIQPKRARRILRATLVFPLFVAYTAWRQKRFLRACTRVAGTLVKTVVNK